MTWPLLLLMLSIIQRLKGKNWCSVAQRCSYWSHQANSHAKKGWEQFTDSVIRTISQKQKGVVSFYGETLLEKSRLIDDTKHHILKAVHPSGLSANRGFFGCRNGSNARRYFIWSFLHVLKVMDGYELSYDLG